MKWKEIAKKKGNRKKKGIWGKDRGKWLESQSRYNRSKCSNKWLLLEKTIEEASFHNKLTNNRLKKAEK